MADIWPAQKRSKVMSLIRSSGNRSTELRLATILRGAGYTGWRRHQKIFGKPDFVFKTERVALFVDGCFWHACPKCYKRPHSNQNYWDEKRRRNRDRDMQVTRELRTAGWTVLRIWGHELNDTNVAATVRKLGRLLGRQ